MPLNLTGAVQEHKFVVKTEAQAEVILTTTAPNPTVLSLHDFYAPGEITPYLAPDQGDLEPTWVKRLLNLAAAKISLEHSPNCPCLPQPHCELCQLQVTEPSGLAVVRATPTQVGCINCSGPLLCDRCGLPLEQAVVGRYGDLALESDNKTFSHPACRPANTRMMYPST